MTDLAKFTERDDAPSGARVTAGRSRPSGATFLSGAQWKAWDGALAVAVLKGSQLRLMFLDDPERAPAPPRSVLSIGVRLRSAVAGSRRQALHLDRPAQREHRGDGHDQIWKVTPS